MSVETLGVVVVPALALLLNHLMPSPEDRPAEETESDEPPPGPTPRTQPARNTGHGDRTSYGAPAAGAMMALVPLLIFGVLGFVALSTFTRRHR
jgi:hypothetical protein